MEFDWLSLRLPGDFRKEQRKRERVGEKNKKKDTETSKAEAKHSYRVSGKNKH